MKKVLAAVAAGALLVAGQAAAAQNTANARVGDRLGAPSGHADEFVGSIPVVLIATAVVVAVVVVASDDDSESD